MAGIMLPSVTVKNKKCSFTIANCCCCPQSEAIPENLKNMLLVMETAGIFQTDAGTESKLWRLTWDKIDTFLPTLRDDIFKPFEPGTVGSFKSSLPFTTQSLQIRLERKDGPWGETSSGIHWDADIKVSCAWNPDSPQVPFFFKA